MAQTLRLCHFYLNNSLHTLVIFMLFLCRLVFLVLLFIPCAEAVASQDAWWITAQGSLLDFNYREYGDSGNLIDKEGGILPGLIIKMGKNQGQWRFAGKLSCHAGDARYIGQTNAGVPISTVTQQQLADAELRADYSIRNDTSVIQGIYVAAGRHYWKRDIQPTYTVSGAPVMGLLERYHWWQLDIGTNAMLYSDGHSRWLLDVRLMRIKNPQVAVYYSGLYDDVRLALGEHWGARLSLPWSYALDSSIILLVEPYVESYRLGRSATVPLTSHGIPVGTVFEPNSSSNNFGLSIGVHKDF